MKIVDDDAAMRRRKRAELASFLRHRRAALQPEAVGLPIRGRRHVGGLRREEVAALAGIGTSWYTMLEQGRVAHVGAKVIEGLATALHFSNAERAYVLGLIQDTPRATTDRGYAEGLEALIHGSERAALFSCTSLADVLSWNELANDLFGFARVDSAERNLLAMMVRRAELRVAFPAWAETLAHMIGAFRAASAHSDPAGRQERLATALGAESPDFYRLWNEHAIFTPTAHICRMRTGGGREVPYHFLTLLPVGQTGENLVALIPSSGA